MRRLSSQQQYDQDDQEDCAKPSANIGAAIVEAATAEQDQQDNDEDYQIHDGLYLQQRNVKSIIRIDEVDRDERLTARNFWEYAGTVETRRFSLIKISIL